MTKLQKWNTFRFIAVELLMLAFIARAVKGGMEVTNIILAAIVIIQAAQIYTMEMRL